MKQDIKDAYLIALYEWCLQSALLNGEHYTT